MRRVNFTTSSKLTHYMQCLTSCCCWQNVDSRKGSRCQRLKQEADMRTLATSGWKRKQVIVYIKPTRRDTLRPHSETLKCHARICPFFYNRCSAAIRATRRSLAVCPLDGTTAVARQQCRNAAIVSGNTFRLTVWRANLERHLQATPSIQRVYSETVFDRVWSRAKILNLDLKVCRHTA